MRTYRRLLLPVLLLVFAAAACGTSGAPEEYDETTEKNYIDGCQVAFGETQATPANEVCGCAYEQIVLTIEFDDFKELDDELRNDVNAISETQTGREVEMIVADCIREVSTS